MYPAIKQHLLSFGYDRLKQTGELGARKKTTNKWFETQDSISYWDDFNRQKIMYPDIASKLSFCIIEGGVYCNNSAYFICSEHVEHLIGFLNSDLINWYYRSLSVQLGDSAVRMFSIYVLNIPIPKKLVEDDIYKSYGLTQEETEFIQSISDNS